jgi:hypothetical protein
VLALILILRFKVRVYEWTTTTAKTNTTATMAALLRRLFSSESSGGIDDERPHPVNNAYQHVETDEEAAEAWADDSDETLGTVASGDGKEQAHAVAFIDEDLPLVSRIFAELRLQLKLAVPIMFTLSCESLPMVISMSFVGQYTSALHIDAVANAQNVYYVCGVAVGLGMCGALETLATQSRGAGNSMAVGFFLVRCLV